MDHHTRCWSFAGQTRSSSSGWAARRRRTPPRRMSEEGASSGCSRAGAICPGRWTAGGAWWRGRSCRGAAARLARGVARAAAKPAVAARLATADEARRRSGLRLGVEDVGIRVRHPRAGGAVVLPVGRRAAGRARPPNRARRVQGRALGARGVVGRPLRGTWTRPTPCWRADEVPERSARSEANEEACPYRDSSVRVRARATWLGSRRNSSSLVACRRAGARGRANAAPSLTPFPVPPPPVSARKPANLARVSSDDQSGKNVLRIL